MSYGFIHRISSATALKGSLDIGAERTRQIASRVAQASLNGDGFALSPATDASGADAVNVEQEMVNLADEQLRFEASAKLLEKVYQQIRTSMRDTR